jgi:uncharacterized membrane protein
VAVFFWFYALSRVDLSFAYPFASLSFVIVIILSQFILGESVSLSRWIAVAVICFGIILLAKS